MELDKNVKVYSDMSEEDSAKVIGVTIWIMFSPILIALYVYPLPFTIVRNIMTLWVAFTFIVIYITAKSIKGD